MFRTTIGALAGFSFLRPRTNEVHGFVASGECQHIIKLVLALFQKSVLVHPLEKSFTIENAAGVLPIKELGLEMGTVNQSEKTSNPSQVMERLGYAIEGFLSPAINL